MKAWQSALDPSSSSGIRFLADPSGAFTAALEMDFENRPIFGGPRSKRYAFLVEDGVVKEVFEEPDATGVNGALFFPSLSFLLGACCLDRWFWLVALSLLRWAVLAKERGVGVERFSLIGGSLDGGEGAWVDGGASWPRNLEPWSTLFIHARLAFAE